MLPHQPPNPRNGWRVWTRDLTGQGAMYRAYKSPQRPVVTTSTQPFCNVPPATTVNHPVFEFSSQQNHVGNNSCLTKMRMSRGYPSVRVRSTDLDKGRQAIREETKHSRSNWPHFFSCRGQIKAANISCQTQMQRSLPSLSLDRMRIDLSWLHLCAKPASSSLQLREIGAAGLLRGPSKSAWRKLFWRRSTRKVYLRAKISAKL